MKIQSKKNVSGLLKMTALSMLVFFNSCQTEELVPSDEDQLGKASTNSSALNSSAKIATAATLDPKAQIFVIQGASLYGVNHIGQWESIGSPTWANSRVMTTIRDNSSLYIIQDPRLYKASATSSTWTQLGTGDWTGTNLMTNKNGYLYMIQHYGLYKTDPVTGTWVRIGTKDWTGSTAIVGNPYGDQLYVAQGSSIYRVHDDGTYVALTLGGDWTGTTHLGFGGDYLYAIKAGRLYKIAGGTVQQVGIGHDWTTTNALTGTSAFLYIIKNGYLYKIYDDGSATEVGGNGQTWSGSSAMTAFYPAFFYPSSN